VTLKNEISAINEGFPEYEEDVMLRVKDEKIEK